jgi:hypothetical protein
MLATASQQHAARRAAAGLAALLTLALVASLGLLADHEHQRAWLAVNADAPAHTAQAASAAPPRI